MLFRSGLSLAMLIVGATLTVSCRAPLPEPKASENPILEDDSGLQLSPKAAMQRSRVVTTHPAAAAGRPDLDAAADELDAHADYADAVVHELNGETDLALDGYFKAASKDSGNEALVLEVSRRLLQAKQLEKARDLLLLATSRPNASGALFARLGFTYFQLGQPDLAVAADRKAIDRQPQSLIGYQNLFLIHLQSSKPREALAVLDEAAKVPRTGAEFLIGLGELYGSFGVQVPSDKESAYARGLAVVQRAAKLRPADPQLQLRLANAFNTLGNEPEAAKIYADLLKKLPDVPFAQDVRARLADIYLREHDQKAAQQQLEGIVADNPMDAQSHYLLGRIAYDNTNFVKAADSFAKVILLQPRFEPAYYELTYAQLMQEHAGEALATLADARQKFRPTFLLEFLTGTAYLQQKDYTNAVKSLTAAEVVARATDPARLDSSFYFQYGAASERAGDYAQAETCFEKCLQLSPNLTAAQNYLGFMWADRGENLERARVLIEKAVKAEPKNAAYLDSMGWVLFKLKEFPQALQYIRDAIRNSDEEDATLYDHLGDIYAAMNEPDKAREAWQKALSLEPTDAIRRKLEPAASTSGTAH